MFIWTPTIMIVSLSRIIVKFIPIPHIIAKLVLVDMLWMELKDIALLKTLATAIIKFKLFVTHVMMVII